jgi:Family of unknown function (DUF6226)
VTRWGPGGPPADAYSRVTRDLATVFAGLHMSVDDRVARLVRTYDATARALSDDEVARLRTPLLRSVAVVPPDAAASPLLVGWTEHPGVIVAAGDWSGPWPAPTCGCDACDEDVEDAVYEFDRVVAGVTAGFREWVWSGLRVEIGHEMASTSGWARYSWRDAKRHGFPRGWRRRRWASWQPGSGSRRDVGSTA